MSFKEDNLIGKRAEQFVAKILKPSYGYLECVGDKIKEYDLVSSKDITFEVKFDRVSQKTDYVAFEYENNDGSPSGIDFTTADYWVHIFHDDGWLLSTAPLSAVRNLSFNKHERIGISPEGAKSYLVRKKFYRRLSWVSTKAISVG